MPALSILDLCPIIEGGSVGQAIDATCRLAKAAERSGYHRFWLAEHHGMQGIASAATSLVISEVGRATESIRIGSGGIMLPNHSPLVIAEQFGTLETLFPGRVDLGIGRAPGSDNSTSRALRRNPHTAAEDFPQDIAELQSYFAAPRPKQNPVAVPGAGLNIPIWILGSSLFSAHLAAQLGLGYAFAAHFAPDHLHHALKIYRREFKPSPHLASPHVIVAAMGSIADSDEEAAYHFTSVQQNFVRMQRDTRGPMPPPVESMDTIWTKFEKRWVQHALQHAIVGSSETAHAKLEAFSKATEADEVMICLPIYSLEARLRAVELFCKIGTATNCLPI